MAIISMFLASAMILPVGLSYASTSNATTSSVQNMTQPGANQTGMNSGMNKTGMTQPGANQTGMNQYAMLHHGMNQTKISTNSTVSPPVTTPKTMPPLEQVKSGVLPKDVQCKQGFTLILKAEDGSPACVTPTVAQILIQRGW